MSRFAVLVAAVLSLFLLSTPFILAQTEPTAALQNDIDILNFALTLENTDSTFFSQFLASFSGTGAPIHNFYSADFVAAGFTAADYEALVQIAQEEINHAAILTATVAALGGTPAPKCTYNFSSVTSVLSYLQTGQLFENTGTSAYDGGINALTNSTLQQAAASIATVEARHASFLNQLLGDVPFSPSAFDTALTPQEVFAIISPFIVSCPNGFDPAAHFPTVRPYGVALASGTNGSTLTTNFTGPLASALTNTYTQADLTNDIDALNYALVLENLEAAFYNYTNSLYNETDFLNAGYNSTTYDYFTIILDNENIHVATLNLVISSLGGTPNPPCDYTPLLSTITSLQTYIATAQLLENTGVSAYDGAVNAFASTALQQVAATIATIEARHAAFLNQLNGDSAFPNTTDTPLSPATVAAAVTPFQICGFTPVLPHVAALQAPAAVIVPVGSSGGSSTGAASASSTGTVSVSSSPVTSVLGDPSFVGFNGQRFQVHGIPNRYFNLLSTPTLQFNALFTMLVDGQSLTAGQMRSARVSRQLQAVKSAQVYPLPLTTAYSHEGTFLAEMSLKFTAPDGTVVRVVATAGPYTTGFSHVTVSGVAVTISSSAVQVATGMYVTLTTPSILTIDTPAVSFTLANADHFFNIEQATLNLPYTADAQMDGLLGQTADETWKVESSREFKQHMVYDYLLADMDGFSDDFVANMYGTSKTEAAQSQ